MTDDNTSDSSGSITPDLEEMWREGCPESPDWDGDVTSSSASVEEDDDGSNPEWNGDVETGSAEVEEEEGTEGKAGCAISCHRNMFSRCEQQT